MTRYAGPELLRQPANRMAGWFFPAIRTGLTFPDFAPLAQGRLAASWSPATEAPALRLE